jgi:hypothetical protein
MQEGISAYLFIKIEFSDLENRRCEMDIDAGPYVTAAFFCEKVLQDKDGSLSAIRIIDRLSYVLPPEGIPQGVRPIVQIFGLISLKSGSLKGTFTLRLNSELPSGKREENIITSTIELKGGDHGQNVILNILLGIQEEGLLWFDVVLEDQLLTKIPLMIVRGQAKSLENE